MVVNCFTSWMHFAGSRRVASQGKIRLSALSAPSKITSQGTDYSLALLTFLPWWRDKLHTSLVLFVFIGVILRINFFSNNTCKNRDLIWQIKGCWFDLKVQKSVKDSELNCSSFTNRDYIYQQKLGERARRGCL